MSNSLTRADADGALSDSDIDSVTALYARKSRRHESDYPSCETQIDTCRLYALSQGWENCVAFVDDGKSDETLERAALKQMLESLRRGEVKRIVMTSLDRLTRKLAHLVKLLDEQRQIKSRKTRVSVPGERKENPRQKPLLRGVLICGECNRPMSTAISHRGSIRYLYYRCRSTAGGRPPCPGVNVQCYEIEMLICGLLSQPLKDESEQVQAIAAAWNQLTEDAKRNMLPAILSKAVFDTSTGEITLGLVDDAAEIVGKAAEAAHQLVGRAISAFPLCSKLLTVLRGLAFQWASPRRRVLAFFLSF